MPNLAATFAVKVPFNSTGFNVPGRKNFVAPANDAERFKTTIGFFAQLVKITPPGPLPPNVSYIRRDSSTYPNPTLDTRGRPVGWAATSVVRAVWGYVQIMVNNVDVTFYRGVATQMGSMVSGEPFGSLGLIIDFPQISPVEPLPSWLQEFCNVEVWKVDGLSNGRVGDSPMWEGMYVEAADSDSQTDTGMSIVCRGALLQGDDHLVQPAVTPVAEDVGHRIHDEMNRMVYDLGLRVGPIERVTTGIQTRNRGSWNPAITGYIQELLAIATIDAPVDVDRNQWTLKLDPGRRPRMVVKDRATVQWTVMCGSPGVVTQLRKDSLESPTTIFGEGIAPDGCHWRNTKYPNDRRDDAPVFPGRIITVGAVGDDVRTWKAKMKETGWPVSMDTPSTYTSNDATQCRRFQQATGLQVDGIVGPQTWAATFQTGSSGGDLSGSYFAPLAWDVATEPYLYDAYGGVVGRNPAFDPQRVRVERYESYGENTDIAQGALYARDALGRDYPAQWTGTLILTADPQEGSRFDIKPGHNTLVRQHRGTDRKFHIAGVDVDFQNLAVSLTIDEQARDLMTLNAIAKRNREATDPTRRTDYRRRSRQIEDRVAVFDCEAGGGRIPYHGTYQKLWNVLRIPMAQYGQVVRTELQLRTPARFSVGIFDRPQSHASLSNGTPLDTGYWDQYDEDDGLIVAFGGDGQMGGYYPKAESDVLTPPLTGRIQDNASWNYQTIHPPWVWVAIWVESPSVNYCEGRLFSAPTVD